MKVLALAEIWLKRSPNTQTWLADVGAKKPPMFTPLLRSTKVLRSEPWRWTP
jgi:hypothetical protein